MSESLYSHPLPASWGLIYIAPHYARREVPCRPPSKNSSFGVLSQGFQRLQLQIYANICKQKNKSDIFHSKHYIYKSESHSIHKLRKNNATFKVNSLSLQ